MITARQRLDCEASNLCKQRVFLVFSPFAASETLVSQQNDSAADTRYRRRRTRRVPYAAGFLAYSAELYPIGETTKPVDGGGGPNGPPKL
jgi:hypothetical protein